jgi:hypothetical protein
MFFGIGSAMSQPRPDTPQPPWCSISEEQLLMAIYDSQNQLKPIIPIRAIAELAACEQSRQVGRASQILKEIKASGYKTDKVQQARFPESQQKEPLFAECVITGVPCIVEVYHRSAIEHLKGKTGGLPFARILGHTGDEGHYEITQRAMKQVQTQLGITWPPSLLEVMANASGDADFYEWDNPAAHAQTLSSNDTGQIGETQPDAHRRFRTWISSYAQQALAACEAGRPADAAYYLGYLLHGVQDLAFHEGITNAEHSYLDTVANKHVDTSDGAFYQQKMVLAQQGSARVITGFSNYVRTKSPQCWASLTRDPVNVPSRTYKSQQLLKRDMDFGLGKIIEFHYLAFTVRDTKSSDTDPRFFIGRRWLDGLQSKKMEEAAQNIVAADFPQ